MILETAFAGVYVVAAVIYAISLRRLNRFVEGTTGIASSADLERYKDLARGQMHLALAILGILIAGLLLGLLLIREHGFGAFLLVLLANAFVFGMGMLHKKVEERARGLRVSSAELRQEYEQVSETWVKKALPDF